MTAVHNSNVILFDIDRTLLNTAESEKRIYTMMAEIMQVEYSEVDAYAKAYINSLERSYYYDFLELLEHISPPKNIYDEILYECEHNRFLYPKYADVVPALKYLKKKDYKIGVYSEGSPIVQRYKLNNMHISEYLDQSLIFMARSKRGDDFIQKLPKGAYIVDDKLDIVEFLAKNGKFKPIHLLRNGPADHDKVYEKGHATIRSLTDLIGIL